MPHDLPAQPDLAWWALLKVKGPVPQADKSHQREGENGRRPKTLDRGNDLIGRPTIVVWS